MVDCASLGVMPMTSVQEQRGQQNVVARIKAIVLDFLGSEGGYIGQVGLLNGCKMRFVAPSSVDVTALQDKIKREAHGAHVRIETYRAAMGASVHEHQLHVTIDYDSMFGSYMSRYSLRQLLIIFFLFGSALSLAAYLFVVDPRYVSRFSWH
jgi:hypothetical protein